MWSLIFNGHGSDLTDSTEIGWIIIKMVENKHYYYQLFVVITFVKVTIVEKTATKTYNAIYLNAP